MKMPIAILAATVGTLMLTATPAYAGEPIPGVDIYLCPNPRDCTGMKAISGKTGRASGGQARRGGKTTDNESPRPTSRGNYQDTGSLGSPNISGGVPTGSVQFKR